MAYEGRALVRMARTSTGRPGFETTPGAYAILRRVASETMTSAGVVGTNGQTASYSVPHVRWTQYFSADGKALHENYWKPLDQFGIPSSHGCAGLLAADAQFLWDWASVGTPSPRPRLIGSIRTLLLALTALPRRGAHGGGIEHASVAPARQGLTAFLKALFC